MMLEIDPTRAVIHLKQGKKKVVTLVVLVDFAVSPVDSVLYLPDRQVKFLGKCFEEIQFSGFYWILCTL